VGAATGHRRGWAGRWLPILGPGTALSAERKLLARQKQMALQDQLVLQDPMALQNVS